MEVLNFKRISFGFSILIGAFSLCNANAIGYPGCGLNVTSCFGSETGCLDSGNCNVMISYNFDKNNKVLNVMLHGKGQNGNEYIAMGLSTDNKMGNDLVRFIDKRTFKYRWTSLYARDRDSKNRLAYNEFAYKKTKDDCKLEVRFQKKGHFQIAYTQNRR